MQNPLKRENDEKEPRIGQQEPQILLPPDRGAAYPLRADAVKGGLGAQPQPLHRRAALRRDVPRGQGRPHETALPRPAERVYRPDFPRGQQLQSGRQGDQHLPFAQHAAPIDPSQWLHYTMKILSPSFRCTVVPPTYRISLLNGYQSNKFENRMVIQQPEYLHGAVVDPPSGEDNRRPLFRSLG